MCSHTKGHADVSLSSSSYLQHTAIKDRTWESTDDYIDVAVITVSSTLSHGNSYIFYEVANSYDLTKPQWRVGLGAGFGVGHLYKFKQIGNL